MTTTPHRKLLPITPLALALLLAFAPISQAAEGDMPMPATRAKAPVTLNFVNAEVEMVSRAIGTMLDRQIVVDPRVRGQITITSERALPPQEAWRSYLAALRGMGFTVVENAGMLKVVPEAEAKLQAGTVQVGTPSARGDQILTQIFKLNHENPNNLVAVLRPLISANNTINANPGSGTLVITDYADNLQRLGKIIAALDQPAASEMEVLTLKHALASDLQPLVQKLLESSGGSTPGAAAAATQGGATSVLLEPRSNALIVRAANPTRMAAAKALIDKLDRPSAEGGPAGNIRVVYLKNADATKLAEVLRAVLASAGSSGGASGSIGGSGLGGGLGASAQGSGATSSALGAGTAGSSGASAQSTAPVAQSARPSTGGQIQADPATNSLIISAPEPVYRQLRQVIDQLDTRRAQIYVESMIVKVDASKAAEFGIQWQSLMANSSNSAGLYAGTNFGSGGNNILNLSLSGGTSTSSSGTTSSVLPGSGLNIGLVQKIQGVYALTSLARFLETNAGGNVLSTPTLMALDNEEAKIVVGQNVPFITGSFTNTGAGSGSTNPFQTVERKDVGLTLRVKSQVGEGGTVRMTIYQENSAVSSNTTSGLITDKSAVETTVVVDDGQMMVLGGLMKDEYTDSDGRVPGLASIPLLGNLFKSDSRTRIKSNLLVFLRPVVIRDQAASDRLVLDRYEAIRAHQQGRQPEASTLLPIGDAPVLPALPGSAPAAPASGAAR